MLSLAKIIKVAPKSFNINEELREFNSPKAVQMRKTEKDMLQKN